DRLWRSSNRGDTMILASRAPLVPTGAVCPTAPCPPNPTFPIGVVITTVGVSAQDDNVRIVGMRDGKVFATTTGSTTLTNVTGANFPAPNPIDLTRNSIGKA